MPLWVSISLSDKEGCMSAERSSTFLSSMCFAALLTLSGNALALGAESQEFLAIEEPDNLVRLEYMSTDEDEAQGRHTYGAPQSKKHRFCEGENYEPMICSSSRNGEITRRYKYATDNGISNNEAAAIFRRYVALQKKVGGSVGTPLGLYLCISGCSNAPSKVLLKVGYGDGDESDEEGE